MTGKILVSTAYLPPIEYFVAISHSVEVLVEREENYLKQTYRNRCYILSAHGTQLLSVPVYLGSIHKTHIKDTRIDYSKRWQQVHLRALKAAYNSSPYFEFYFENIENTISKNHEFIIDMNMELTQVIIDFLKLGKKISFTTVFEQENNREYDFRYRISPKKEPLFPAKEYYHVFNDTSVTYPRLSILDLIFNMGPDAGNYL